MDFAWFRITNGDSQPKTPNTMKLMTMKMLSLFWLSAILLLASSRDANSQEIILPHPNYSWMVSDGAFEITSNSIKAIGKGENYVWIKHLLQDYELSFNAIKSPVNGEFRLNIGAKMGCFYQIVIPWEGGGCRIDYLNNGEITNVVMGLPDVTSDKYQVKVKVINQHVSLWIDDKPFHSQKLEFLKSGFVGFGTFKGVEVGDLFFHGLITVHR